ncbi:hypothetical protein MK489_20260 [Myxococcota bacterium]|nr:hypothetical protein [Myxococcota bacterium]
MKRPTLDQSALGLWVVLLVSLLLRVVLVLRGGVYYWPDERRYEVSQHFVKLLGEGEVGEVLRWIAYSPAHAGFKLLGILPAALQHSLDGDLLVPALWFCVAPVISIGLVWIIALRSGASRQEALTSAFLLALSTSALYYSRHLLPYDASLSLGLLAVALASGRIGDLRAFAAGLAASATFLVYNGYWTLAAVALLLCVVKPNASNRERFRFALACALGFGAPIWALAMASALAGADFLNALFAFSGTIDQGDFDEGWKIPFEYLWHSEHALALLWLATLAYAVREIYARRAPSRVVEWGIAVAVSYLALAVTSSLLEKFVVYGRLTRQFVPFLCLLGGFGLLRLRQLTPRGAALFGTLLFLASLQAAFNFGTPLNQVFPEQFERAAIRIGKQHPGIYEFVHAQHIYPIAEAADLPDEYEVVLSARHPLQYLPYQYEGFGAEQRRSLRENDITMRLIRLPRRRGENADPEASQPEAAGDDEPDSVGHAR